MITWLANFANLHKNVYKRQPNAINFYIPFFYIYDAHNGQDFSWNDTCTLIRFNT